MAFQFGVYPGHTGKAISQSYARFGKLQLQVKCNEPLKCGDGVRVIGSVGWPSVLLVERIGTPATAPAAAEAVKQQTDGAAHDCTADKKPDEWSSGRFGSIR